MDNPLADDPSWECKVIAIYLYIPFPIDSPLAKRDKTMNRYTNTSPIVKQGENHVYLKMRIK